MLFDFANKLICPYLKGSWHSSSITEGSQAFTRATVQNQNNNAV